ncbi:hypothetical protein M569_14412, partial [Genlisea aurea]
KMSKFLSPTALRNWWLKASFYSLGLRSVVKDIGDGTVMNCWLPREPDPDLPNLFLIHGFGSNSLWQFHATVRLLIDRFNIYLPDLIFFGESTSARPDRSIAFQAESVKRLAELNSVDKMVVLGLSYGGFVAYSLAAQFPECVERVVICCAGLCLKEGDLEKGLFPAADVDQTAALLLPQTADELRDLFCYIFVKPLRGLPSWLLQDFIREMLSSNAKQKKELIQAIFDNQRLTILPKISQPTLIVWGDQDRIFPVELAHRLKRHLGDNSELVMIKDAGHSFIHEKPAQFHDHLKAFLSNRL